MGLFSNRMKKTADKLITKYGSSITLVMRTNADYNTTTGETSHTETLYPDKGKISNFITASDGVSPTVETDDLRCLVDTDLSIDKTWQIEYDSKRWEVIDVTRITTQDDIITQAIQIRALG